MTRVGSVAFCASACWGMVPPLVAQPSETPRGLTAITGVRVGHHTLDTRPTGCTVVLTEAGAVATDDVRGSSPGTRETALQPVVPWPMAVSAAAPRWERWGGAIGP